MVVDPALRGENKKTARKIREGRYSNEASEEFGRGPRAHRGDVNGGPCGFDAREREGGGKTEMRRDDRSGGVRRPERSGRLGRPGHRSLQGGRGRGVRRSEQ